MTLTEALEAHYAAAAATTFAGPGQDADLELAALAAVHQLLTLVDAAQATAVTLTRGAGATWAEVAAALGVTKQAAQQRYGG